MLYGGMRESFRETCHEGVELKDVSYVVFLKILEFLYTETVLDIPPRRRRATAHRGGTNVRSPLLQSVKPGLRRGFTERQAAPQCTISRPRAFRSSARSDGDASDGDASDTRDGDASDVDARARRARAALTRSFTTPRRAGAPVRGEEHGSGAFFRSPW